VSTAIHPAFDAILTAHLSIPQALKAARVMRHMDVYSGPSTSYSRAMTPDELEAEGLNDDPFDADAEAK
jgi:hypothetical protein